jgi:hypothetical protein
LSKPNAASSGGSSGHIDIEREQIADRVRVLGAIEPPQHRTTRSDRCGAIQFALEPRDEAIGRLSIWPRRAEWWHGADPQLPHRLLPDRGVRWNL